MAGFGLREKQGKNTSEERHNRPGRARAGEKADSLTRHHENMGEHLKSQWSLQHCGFSSFYDAII